jgi:hypothetical protein
MLIVLQLAMLNSDLLQKSLPKFVLMLPLYLVSQAKV